MQKADRHKKILQLIAEKPLSRQEELVAALREGGFEVTQASVSRDLDELGVVKIGGRYEHSGPGTPSDPFGIYSIEPSGCSLIVVRCEPGMASAAAVRIDGKDIKGIAGTIAGDDTVFVAVSSEAAQRAVIRRLKQQLAFRPEERGK
jgi:transcriptional regulator of arginine metabolism